MSEARPPHVKAVQLRTPDNTDQIPWSKEEILLRLEIIRLHAGWVTQGLMQYGVDVEMSAAIATADNQFRQLRNVESQIYREELTRK